MGINRRIHKINPTILVVLVTKNVCMIDVLKDVGMIKANPKHASVMNANINGPPSISPIAPAPISLSYTNFIQ